MKRWYVYMLLGLGFGVLDWFYLDWLAFSFGPSLGSSSLLMIPLVLGMNYGIWLVPIIPAVIFESRKASGIKQPILAGILTWCSAIFSYYAFYSILLSLGKLPIWNTSISSGINMGTSGSNTGASLRISFSNNSWNGASSPSSVGPLWESWPGGSSIHATQQRTIRRRNKPFSPIYEQARKQIQFVIAGSRMLPYT